MANRILECLFLMIPKVFTMAWLPHLTEKFLYIKKHLHMGHLLIVWIYVDLGSQCFSRTKDVLLQ